MAIMTFLVVPALIIAVLRPRAASNQAAGRTPMLIDLVLPGTSPHWKYFGGIVLVAWTFALLFLFPPLSSLTAPFPDLQKSFAVPIDSDALAARPSTTPAIAAMVVLWAVNTALISYSRRNTATIPS
jgi:hypothetical protein